VVQIGRGQVPDARRKPDARPRASTRTSPSTTSVAIPRMPQVPSRPGGALPSRRRGERRHPCRPCRYPGRIAARRVTGLSITKSDASVWPPPVAAPRERDRDARLVGKAPQSEALPCPRSRVDVRQRSAADGGGRPVSFRFRRRFSVDVSSPPLPIPAAPTTRPDVGDSPSVTVHSQGNLGANVVAPIATMSLATDGAPGFPVDARRKAASTPCMSK
jgi:hypothetical protein